MENIKLELEKKVSNLTAIYGEMLKELADLYDSREEIKKELELCEQNFNNVHILVDCVVGRLNESKKLLNAIYNNEEFVPVTTFIFDRYMVRNEKKDNDNIQTSNDRTVRESNEPKEIFSIF